MSTYPELDYALLKKLSQAFGPSGNERDVREILLQQIDTKAYEIQVDPLGNLIIRKPGEGKKVLIVSHMDEVGIIVTHIDDKGYLYFAPVGGLKRINLIAKRVRFGNGRVGVISVEKNPTEEGNTHGKIYIDIGVSSEQEARKVIKEGDMAVLVGDFQETSSHIISKAIDDRVGCFIAIEILKQIKCPYDLYFAFSVQEEVGARGAKTVVHEIEPDIALIVDTTLSFDSPKDKNRTSLGLGAAIKVMDRSIVVSPLVKNWMAEVARDKNISFQWEIISEGGTDAGPIHLTRGGIPTGGIAIPVRYLHSGNEIVTKFDIETAFKLTYELLGHPFNTN